MRNAMKSHDLNGQKEENVKKPHKHDANLQKNTTIYFQIGLIVCLLFCYGLLEMKFETKKYVPEIVSVYEDPIDYVPNNFKIFEKPVKEVEKVQKKSNKITDVIKVAKNDAVDIIETQNIITTPETTNKKPIAISDVIDVKTPEDPVVVPYDFVEVVPVFPGCEGAPTNAERKACMSEKIAKHIQEKFDTNIASDLGLEGVQKINVQFKIDQNGNVKGVKARSVHKQLEEEAKDVIGKLPQMKPGKQHNKNVSVIYGIPIIFNVQN